jgi:uncharacterized protein YbjQ (UPF0145 family)
MKKVICAAAAAFAMGCADQMTEPQVPASPPSIGAHRFGQFDPIDVPSMSSDVRVIDGDSAGCESEALGVVESSDRNRSGAIEMMRTRAATLGAEAIVGVTSRRDGYTATAVRCRDLRSGRAYDVVEKISIPVDAGNQERAFEALRARAYDLRADLIIDITSEPTRLEGTAIRYK